MPTSSPSAALASKNSCNIPSGKPIFYTKPGHLLLPIDYQYWPVFFRYPSGGSGQFMTTRHRQKNREQ
jgi:hypothetical protein